MVTVKSAKQYISLTVKLQQNISYENRYKTRGCHCSHWAPDDGREKARNMLNC